MAFWSWLLVWHTLMLKSGLIKSKFHDELHSAIQHCTWHQVQPPLTATVWRNAAECHPAPANAASLAQFSSSHSAAIMLLRRILITDFVLWGKGAGHNWWVFSWPSDKLHWNYLFAFSGIKLITQEGIQCPNDVVLTSVGLSGACAKINRMPGVVEVHTG